MGLHVPFMITLPRMDPMLWLTLRVCLIGVCLQGYSNGGQLHVTRLPSLPQALSNNAVTSVLHADGTATLYSFMGIRNPRQSNTITAASYRLDLPGGVWVAIRNAPTLNNRAKIGANAVTVAGSVYLIGGYTVSGFAERTEKRFFKYDPQADNYVELAPVPFEVDDTITGVYQDRYLYLVSGWHGPINDNTLRVQIYDTQTNTWSQGSPLPGPNTGLFGHTGTLLGDRWVVTDGVKVAGHFQISSSVYVGSIDPEQSGAIDHIVWTESSAHPGFPTYRAAGSQGPDELGRFLLLGGTTNPYNFNGTGYNGQPAMPLDQALAYAPQSSSWETLELTGDLMPTMDHRGLVRVPGGWATIGGMTAPGISTSEVLKYEIVPEPAIDGRWLVILAVGYFGFPGRRTRWK
jgi:Kelch motif